MKTLIMLVGLPGSGKSTLCQDFKILKLKTEIKIISLDRMIEKTMISGESYAEAFLRVQKTGELKDMDAKMYKEAEEYNLINDEIVVIWDQTNLTVKTRKRKLDMFDSSWDKFAYVFELSDKEWEYRLQKRQDETGKSIPSHVLMDMKKSYERPSLDEGFCCIEYM